MLLGQSYSYSVDWWQLGIAIFEMLTSQTPFYSRSMLKTHQNVLCNKRLKFPLNISSLAKSTCMKLLEPNINKRLGCSINGMDAKEIKENLWFKNYIDWIKILERSYPAPYQLKIFQINNSKESNTIESKWLDEYDQIVRSLMDINLTDEKKTSSVVKIF